MTRFSVKTVIVSELSCLNTVLVRSNLVDSEMVKMVPIYGMILNQSENEWFSEIDQFRFSE